MSNTPPDDEPKDESDELIHDLKSIKNLLDDETAHANSTEQDTSQVQRQVENDADIPLLDTDDVPLLDDPLEEAVSVDEGMPEETFKTLLGDAWQESVEELFNDARRRIQENSEKWLPEHTDELADALKIRIDASVRAWLAETLEANIGRLRERIVSELSKEILGHMREKLNQTTTEGDHPNHG